MATTKQRQPKAGESLKDLQAGLEDGSLSKTAVERVLTRRLASKMPGTAIHGRTTKSLANLKAGRPLDQNVWPTKPKASPKPKRRTNSKAVESTSEAGVSLSDVHDIVAKTVAESNRGILNEIAIMMETMRGTAPEAEDVIEDDEEAEDVIEDEAEVGGVQRTLVTTLVVGSDDEPYAVKVWSFTEGEEHPENAVGVDDDGFMVNDQGDYVNPDGSIEAAEYNSAK